MTDAVHHLTPIEKTTAIIVLAEALNAVTLVGNPAPIVRSLRAWMDAPPQVGDLVVEMSTKHRGPNPSRVGIVNKIVLRKNYYDCITEILVLDPPCGDTECTTRKCIHRWRWNNASFVRVPATPEQLAEALDRSVVGDGRGVDRDGLIGLLAEAGIGVRSP